MSGLSVSNAILHAVASAPKERAFFRCLIIGFGIQAIATLAKNGGKRKIFLINVKILSFVNIFSSHGCSFPSSSPPEALSE